MRKYRIVLIVFIILFASTYLFFRYNIFTPKLNSIPFSPEFIRTCREIVDHFDTSNLSYLDTCKIDFVYGSDSLFLNKMSKKQIDFFSENSITRIQKLSNDFYFSTKEYGSFILESITN